MDMDIETGAHNPQRVRNQLRNDDSSDGSIQITITPAGFDCHPNDSTIPFGLPPVRRSSFDAMAITRRVSIPERSASSMSHCPGYEPIPSHMFFVQTISSNKTCKKSGKKEKESESLPGLLKSSTNGSTNCCMKSATTDLKHLATRFEKGNPLTGTTCLRKDTDNELLITNEKPPDQVDCSIVIQICIDPPELSSPDELKEEVDVTDVSEIKKTQQ